MKKEGGREGWVDAVTQRRAEQLKRCSKIQAAQKETKYSKYYSQNNVLEHILKFVLYSSHINHSQLQMALVLRTELFSGSIQTVIIDL